ncbi:MAG TPA: CHASE4 domain-containing protein, partial [Bauldia sp.]|nr:CHASE4 domain-containing protein [Bauldia sp.]
MTNSISGRITLNLVAGIVITVVTVIAAIFWMAARQDEQARASTETMVIGGVDAVARRAEALANDYGWWDDAYFAYVRRDEDWFYTNVGASVSETRVADLFAVVSPDGEVVFGWVIDDKSLPTEILTPDVIEGIRNLAEGMPVESLAARSAFVRFGSTPMVIAVSRITPFTTNPDIDPAELPFFVAGLELNNDRLSELGKTFLIDDLRFETGDARRHSSATSTLPVVDIFGETIGQYTWTPPKPGDAVLRSVLPPIAVALVLFCVVAVVTALRTRRIAIALTESEKEAVTAARTDGMTGLKNRTGFNELLQSPEYQAACRAGHLAVIYLDINGFKAV